MRSNKYLTLHGVEIEVFYTIDGEECPATETDPASHACACVEDVHVAGVSILPLVADGVVETLATMIEDSWRG